MTLPVMLVSLLPSFQSWVERTSAAAPARLDLPLRLYAALATRARRPHGRRARPFLVG